MPAAPFVATSTAIFVDGYSLAADSYAADCKASSAPQDKTNFASAGNVELLGGLVAGSFDLSGFMDPSLNVTALNAKFANAVTLVTVAPAGTSNDTAFMLRSLESEIKGPGLQIGNMAKHDAHFASANLEGPLLGKLIVPSTLVSTTGTGTVQNNGAAITGQSVYGFLHVVGRTGTAAIAATLKSAALVGFGSPTTRLTFATLSAIGADYQTVAGPITDAFWRVDYTITGAGTITFAVGMAIQ